MTVKVCSECEWGLDRVCGTKLRGRQASQRWLHAPRRKKDGGRIVNSEAKRKGVEVPDLEAWVLGRDGQRARGSHRVPRKGYSGKEGRQRTGQGRGVKRGE